jgi:mannose-6-phosphate isomerase-like protein (cupin superfamily)
MSKKMANLEENKDNTVDPAYLFSPNESDEFPTEERCHILELANNHLDRPMSIARARVESGVTTAWHRLDGTTEYYYILDGRGLMFIGEEEPFEVKKGEVVTIPEGEAQRIRNIDPEEDLLFLAICTPAFTDKIYESLE